MPTTPRPFRLAIVLCPILLAGPAFAADEGPVGRSAIGDELHEYYDGEKLSAFVLGGFGAAAAAAGGVLVTRDTDFARGFGWPLLALGALQLVGGFVYVLQVNGEIDHYGATLARDPSAFKEEERSHIQGTTSRFVFYRLFELGLTLGGAAVAAYGFASNRDAGKGAGLGIAAVALPLLVIDSFNNARAQHYLEDLGRFEPTLALSPAGLGGGMVSFTGKL